jgi:hypothetical protein
MPQTARKCNSDRSLPDGRLRRLPYPVDRQAGRGTRRVDTQPKERVELLGERAVPLAIDLTVRVR